MDGFSSLIDLKSFAQRLSGAYQNVVISQCNDHVVRMSRMESAYFWHVHPNSDELFLVLEGVLLLELPNQQIRLQPGQVYCVAQGWKHRTAPETNYSINVTVERADMETIRLE